MDEKLIEKIDAAIGKVADDIAEDKIFFGALPDTVVALAALVEARVSMPIVFKTVVTNTNYKEKS